MTKLYEVLRHRSGRALAACGIAIGVLALGIVPAAAQTTLRLSPDPAIFPTGGSASVSIIAENVDSNGLAGWKVYLTFNPSQVSFVTATVNPSDASAFGPITTNSVDPNTPGQIVWNVESSASFNGPTGTVTLGTMTFQGASTASTGQFVWDQQTRLSTGIPFFYNVL